EPAELPTGQLPPGPRAEAGEADAVERGRGGVPGRPARHALEPAGVRDLLTELQPRHRLHLLRQPADPTPVLLAGLGGVGDQPPQPDPPGVRLDRRGGDPEQGRPPGPLGTGQDGAAPSEGERQFVEYVNAPPVPEGAAGYFQSHAASWGRTGAIRRGVAPADGSVVDGGSGARYQETFTVLTVIT